VTGFRSFSTKPNRSVHSARRSAYETGHPARQTRYRPQSTCERSSFPTEPACTCQVASSTRRQTSRSPPPRTWIAARYRSGDLHDGERSGRGARPTRRRRKLLVLLRGEIRYAEFPARIATNAIDLNARHLNVDAARIDNTVLSGLC